MRNRARESTPWDRLDLVPRYHAPTNGRGIGFTHGGKLCKDVCSSWNCRRPFGDPYPTHFRCTACDIWATFEHLNEKGRCSCCNKQVRRSGRCNHKKVQ